MRGLIIYLSDSVRSFLAESGGLAVVSAFTVFVNMYCFVIKRLIQYTRQLVL